MHVDFNLFFFHYRSDIGALREIDVCRHITKLHSVAVQFVDKLSRNFRT